MAFRGTPWRWFGMRIELIEYRFCLVSQLCSLFKDTVNLLLEEGSLIVLLLMTVFFVLASQSTSFIAWKVSCLQEWQVFKIFSKQLHKLNYYREVASCFETLQCFLIFKRAFKQHMLIHYLPYLTKFFLNKVNYSKMKNFILAENSNERSIVGLTKLKHSSICSNLNLGFNFCLYNLKWLWEPF